MGKIKIEKGFTPRVFTYSGVAAVFFIGFIFVFTSLFGPSAGFFKYALADITIVAPYISALWTLDWAVSIMWNIALLLLAAVFITGITDVTKESYNLKNALIPACVVAALVLVGEYLNDFSFAAIISYATNELLYVAWGVSLAFLLLSMLLFFVKRGQNDKIKAN